MKEATFIFSDGKNLDEKEKLYYELTQHFMECVGKLLEDKTNEGKVLGGDIFEVLCRVIAGMLANIPQIFKQLQSAVEMQAIIYEVAHESLKAALDVYPVKGAGTLQ